MTVLILVVGGGFLLASLVAVAAVRRRIYSGPQNNWRNEAYLAREAAGSWSENENAVGHEDAAPPSYIPGVR